MLDIKIRLSVDRVNINYKKDLLLYWKLISEYSLTGNDALLISGRSFDYDGVLLNKLKSVADHIVSPVKLDHFAENIPPAYSELHSLVAFIHNYGKSFEPAVGFFPNFQTLYLDLDFQYIFDNF